MSLNGRLIPLLPAGRGGIGIFASLWLSRSRASRSFRILVSSRADRSDRLSAGWLRAARFRLAGCSAAGTAGPMSGTYAHPGVAFVVVLAISMTPKLFMVMFSVGWRGWMVERGLVQRVSGHFDKDPKPGSTTPGADQGNPVQASDRLL